MKKRVVKPLHSSITFHLGGAYYDLCDNSKEDCLEISTVENGFYITRDIESLAAIFANTKNKTKQKIKVTYRLII